ncbi:hypothetical protein TorRG33x02_211310, partial [Trema orientale]
KDPSGEGGSAESKPSPNVRSGALSIFRSSVLPCGVQPQIQTKYIMPHPGHNVCWVNNLTELQMTTISPQHRCISEEIVVSRQHQIKRNCSIHNPQFPEYATRKRR